MKEKSIYKLLDYAAAVTLLLISSTIFLLFSNVFSFETFRITMVILLLLSFVLFLYIRKVVAITIKHGKMKFKSAEDKFGRIYESPLIGIVITNFNGDIILANDQFLNMLGYVKEDIKNKTLNWNQLTPPEFKHLNAKAVNQLKNEGTCIPFEKQYYKKDGSTVWVMLGSSKLKNDEEGDAITFVIDITEKKLNDLIALEYQQIFNNKQEELNSVFMNAPALISIKKGEELRYEFVNKALMEFSGKSNQIGKTIDELYPGEDYSEEKELSRKVYETGIPVKDLRYKYIAPTENGETTEKYLDFNIYPIYDAYDNISGVASYGFEVTDLIKANQEMEISQNKFSLMADSLPHKIWMSDAHGKITYLNQFWFDYLQKPKTDLPDWNWNDLIIPEELEMIKSFWKNAIINKSEFSIEHRLKRFDGECRWHLSKGFPLLDKKGEFVMWVGTSTDIHDQKLQVEELRNSEVYFRTLANETPFMVWKTDKEGNCVYVNKTWIEFTGLSFEDSLGQNYKQVMPETSYEQRVKNFNIAKEGNSSIESKYQLYRADGKLRWVFSQSNPYYINGNFEGYIGSIIDITDQEVALQAIEDLSHKKDEFISIASHELKTPLTSVKGFIQLIEKHLRPEDKVFNYALKASEHLIRLERLISDLLDVSKINAGKLSYNATSFNFNNMLQDSIYTVQQVYNSHHIEQKTETDIEYFGDKNRIEQVVYNLLINAIKYSPASNKVIIRSYIENNNIVVAIQDFGIGIVKEDQDQVFDRYYRVDNTSMRFQGLGLGLFISNEIIKRHNGHLRIDSEKDKGSTFYFSLPLQSPTV